MNENFVHLKAKSDMSVAITQTIKEPKNKKKNLIQKIQEAYYGRKHKTKGFSGK